MIKNPQNQNARIGAEVEKRFKNSVSHHPDVIQKIKNYYNVKGEFDGALTSGVQGEKADVILGFTDGRNINANIKSFKGQGFNQITRTSVRNFCVFFKINEEKKQNLESIVIRKAKNKTRWLFNEAERATWKPVFQALSYKILKWSFSHKYTREILVLFDRNKNEFLIYPMKKLLNSVPKEINFTKGGFNIGNCVSFQRKGGNGVKSRHISKESIEHPGNDLQLKLKCAKLVKFSERILLAKYKIQKT